MQTQTTQPTLVQGRNYLVVVPGDISLNQAYVYACSDKEGNHVFTRPSPFRRPEGMRVIFIEPEWVSEIKERVVRVTNYLVEACEKDKQPERFKELSSLWGASQK